jgi:hypothetical protein
MATTLLTIDEQARALGHAVWLERRCFELLGGWVRSPDEPEVALWFAATSRHHGEHALMLERLLPATRDHDPATTVGPVDDEWPARLDAWSVAASTADRHAAAQELVAAAIESHSLLESSLTTVADAPAIRAVRAVLADELQDLTALDGGERARPEAG